MIDGLGFAGDESRLMSLGQNLDRNRFDHSVLTVNPLAYSGESEFRARKRQYLHAGLDCRDLS